METFFQKQKEGGTLGKRFSPIERSWKTENLGMYRMTKEVFADG
jgi:hypothetical protein